MEALIAYFGLAVMGMFFGTGLLIASAADRRRVSLAEVWRAYAARHRYAFAEGTTPERAFSIQGSREGVEFILETDTRGSLVTRLRTRRLQPYRGRVIAALGRSRRGEADGGKTSSGDRHFDQLFDVRASDPLAAEEVLRPQVRQALQRFPTPMVGKALRLAVEHDTVIIEWAGGDVDPAPIEAAHAILREVCRVRDR
jgi:hypothetical protein